MVRIVGLALVVVATCMLAGPATADSADRPTAQAWARPSGPGAEPLPGPRVPAAGRSLLRLPVDGSVRRPFSPPMTPYGPGHRGVDLTAAPGTEVTAALDGTVSFSGTVAGVGWVTVQHGGELATTYGPLEPRLVSRGAAVRSGDPLGLLAEDATHLDWGARLGEGYVDPLSLLEVWRVGLVHPDTPPPDPAAVRSAAGAVPSRPAGGRLQWPATGTVSSRFGMRIHPVSRQPRLHAGVDIAAPQGSPVRAAAAGRVVKAGAAGGYGNLVAVDHGGGLVTRYAHLASMAVAPGEAVAPGQRLGAVGSTGLSTGPHLHFEVRHRGMAQDPLPWLR